jgi:hypothetical protein
MGFESRNEFIPSSANRSGRLEMLRYGMTLSMSALRWDCFCRCFAISHKFRVENRFQFLSFQASSVRERVSHRLQQIFRIGRI